VLRLAPKGKPSQTLESCILRAAFRCPQSQDRSAPAEMRQAIRTVHRGEAFFSSPVARQLSAAVRQETLRGEQGEKLERLTDRERQVLAGIAAGSTSKLIAQQLGLSPRTVEAYRENLMRKLAIRTVAGLTRFAVENGLVAE